MRYMMLVYSTEGPDGMPPEEAERIRAGHAAVIGEASRKGVLIGAEPLAPTSTATTVRHENGKVLVTDGPFGMKLSGGRVEWGTGRSTPNEQLAFNVPADDRSREMWRAAFEFVIRAWTD